MRSPLRTALLALTAVAAVAAVLLLVRDVRTGPTNCGSALLARDISSLEVVSGDPAEDDFNEQATISRCRRLILRQRYFGALAIGVALVGSWGAKRARPKPERFPGDPIL